MSANDRRRFLRAMALAGGRALLAGCDRLADSKSAIPVAAGRGRRTDRRRAAGADARRCAGPGVHRGRHLAGVQGQRLGQSADAGIPGDGRRRLRHYRLQVGGLVERPLSLDLAQLRALAFAHPDHPPRLRRGLELHRQVEGRAAGHAARPGRSAAEARATWCSAAPTAWTRPRALLRERVPVRGLPPAEHPGLRHERRRCSTFRMARRLRVRLERKLGYKMAKYTRRHRPGRQSWTASAAARAAIGRTAATSGTAASDLSLSSAAMHHRSGRPGGMHMDDASHGQKRRREPMSRVDTAWLRMERATNLMMITSVMMFEEPMDLDRLKRMVKQRFLAYPRFRQKAVDTRRRRLVGRRRRLRPRLARAPVGVARPRRQARTGALRQPAGVDAAGQDQAALAIPPGREIRRRLGAGHAHPPLLRRRHGAGAGDAVDDRHRARGDQAGSQLSKAWLARATAARSRSGSARSTAT